MAIEAGTVLNVALSYCGNRAWEKGSERTRNETGEVFVPQGTAGVDESF